MNRWGILSLFPEMFSNIFLENKGVVARAVESEQIAIRFFQIRDFSENKHRNVDDIPYGGGSGMVMTPQPIVSAIEEAKKQFATSTPVIYFSPQGEVFNQAIAAELATYPELIFLCGRYEEIDQRVKDRWIDREISIGDFVLSGGELATMVVLDATARMIPGVLGNPQSTEEESFQRPLLEYPHYTRPPVFRDQPVPEILLSGHHANIEKWRFQQSVLRTAQRREDLLPQNRFSKKEKKWLLEIKDSFSEAHWKTLQQIKTKEED